MKRTIALIAILVAMACSVAVAGPAAERLSDIQQYVSAMRECLAGAGIRVQRIDSPREDLLVDYALTDQEVRPEFALAAVLKLAQPVAGDARAIRVRNMRGGRKLLEVSVAPGDVEGVLDSTVGDQDRVRINDLLAEALAACESGEPEVPVATTSRDVRPRAIIIRQGDVPVAASDVITPTAARTTQPRVAQATAQPSQASGQAATGPSEDRETPAQSLFELLRASDLENIEIARDADGQWVISFENRTWRSDLDALAAALEQIADVLPSAAVTLRLKRHGVVVSHVRVELADYVKLQAGLVSGGALAQTWDVGAGPGQVARPLQLLASGNESYLRTDLMFRPAIEYQIGLESDPFESDCYLLTNLETTFRRGLSGNVRLKTRVTSDQSIEMDRALITWTGRPSENLLATGSMGKFRDNIYGYYGEVQFGGENYRVGATGSLTDTSFSLDPFDKWERAFAYYEYDWGEMGLKSRLGYGKFQESGDTGFALSLRRRFGESVVETQAVRTDDGDEGLVFGLSVPFGSRRVSRPDGLRARADTAFATEYLSNYSFQGDSLQGPQDLDSFHGELAASYLRHHGERLLGERDEPSTADWPAAPSLEGTSGLLRIPTADVAQEGRLLTGISYMARDHAKVQGADTDAMPTFVGMGFLPNLELVGRLTFFHDVQAFSWPYNLDRSFNVHYRINSQRGEWLPAFAVGAQDVSYGTTSSYLGQAQYVVGTWRHDNWRVHLGLGSGRYDPVFAGVDAAVSGPHKLHLMADYDSQYVNTGLRVFLGDWGTASVGLLGMKELAGAVTFQTDLR